MRWLRVGFYLFLLLPMICFAELLDSEIATQTFIIGTPEQPTIDGGVVNAPDSRKNKKDVTNNLSDEFEDDKNIKSLLSDAAKNGKLAYVLQRAEQLKLPATVALIPMVESRYQTNAVSSKGATGAWQLMPATANNYGLNSKSRTNFMASTDAALHLLSDLHQQFGNSTLAFAAYNAGSKRVISALYQPPKAKFDDLDLPLETKIYMKKLKILLSKTIVMSQGTLR